MLSHISPAPILLKAPSGNAYFDGYWETIAVQQTSISDESTIQYNAYRCDIGSPFGESTPPPAKALK